MVKHLRHLSTFAKLVVLGVLLVVIWGAIWLRSDIHSFRFAKPWILGAMNPKDASYHVDFEDVVIDWRDTAKLGTLKITNITLANKDGLLMARMPAIYASVDPLGMLPGRSLLNTVILNEPHLALKRSSDGAIQVGLEGADTPFDLSALAAQGSEKTPRIETLRLPFRYLMINHGAVKFTDEMTGHEVLSDDFALRFGQRDGHYQAAFQVPLIYQQQRAMLRGGLLPIRGSKDYQISVKSEGFPGELLCQMATCPDEASLMGALNFDVRLRMRSDGSFSEVAAHILARQTTLKAPAWFEKPLKLMSTDIHGSYDLDKHYAVLEKAVVVTEDSTLGASAIASRKEDGWYADVNARTSMLEVTKLSKYWPIALAPETRSWVTSKLKSGRATGSAHLMLDPAAIAAADLPDKALAADVKTYDVTVDYLPNFPPMNHVDSDIHFTGTTVKINGRNGSLLSGTQVSSMTLFCPNLLHPNNPMEIELKLAAPVSDVASILAIKHFAFDDSLALDPTKAQGQVNATLGLKFNSFSESSKGADDIHFDAVDYDIKAHIDGFAQNGLAGGYDVRGLRGDLVANTRATKFDGALALGDSGMMDVSVDDSQGNATQIRVKSRGEQGKPPANDFSVSYQSQPESTHVNVSGKRLDASVSYGGRKNSLLKDFPALNLTVDLAELVLVPALPFTDVKGNLNCSIARCESAHFDAMRGKATVRADITRNQGQRQFQLIASDAGDFLKGLDITDRMSKGALELKGTYSDLKTPPSFAGRLFITDFNLKNSQILGRILSIGSFTGLANALTGSGIAFSKLAVNIDHNAGVVELSEGSAHGAAMGITVEGTVDTNTTALRLKGVVVPAYMLNSLLSNIPIIGELAGGAGEGLIAFNYSVKGTYHEPDVSVNPLSALTPGFLRGIFNAGENKKTEDEKQKPNAGQMVTPTKN